MVIRVFVLSLLLISILFYFMPIENRKKMDNQEDIALLEFNEATMYTLTTESMNRVVYTKKALRYKTKDMLYSGALTLKSKNSQNLEITDVLYADLIVRRDNEFKFINNVTYKRGDYITLNTNELIYNADKKIAKNDVAFDGTYYENILNGRNIYLDLNKDKFKANNTHFEINLK